MKIRTISYQKTFNLGNYMSERIGIEMELAPDDKEQRVFEEAKAFVESCHKPIINEEIPSDNFGLERQLQEIQVEKPQSTEEKIITQINECSDITVLKSFYLLIKNNDAIADAYSKKLKQLQP